MYKLTEFKLTDVTDSHYFFTLTIETNSFWDGYKRLTIDCQKPKSTNQSKLLSNGECLFRIYPDLDDSINAILSKKDLKMLKIDINIH
jgi:hypothetical protein